MKLLICLSLVLSGLFAARAQADGPSFARNISDKLKAQVTNDLTFAAGLQGNDGTALYREIFGDKLDGQNLAGFFADRISHFALSDCGGGPGVAACAGMGHTMWITQNYINFDMPQLYRVSAIYHESRHTEVENGNWPHVNCPTPFKNADGTDIKGIMSGTLLAGLPACDETQYGAYGLQAELLKNVQYSCQNCTDKVKMDGQIYGDDTVKRLLGDSNVAMKKDLAR